MNELMHKDIEKIAQPKRKTPIMKKVKKWAKETKQEIENCDCTTFVEDKKREAIQAIKSYNSIIKDADWLIEQIKQIRELKYRNSENMRRLGDETFLSRRINDFINQLEKRQSDAFESKKAEEN